MTAYTLSLLCLTALVLHCRGAERVEVRSLLQHALHRRQGRSEPVTSYPFKRNAEVITMTELNDVMALEREANLEVVQKTMSVQGTQVVKMQESYKGRDIPDAVVTLETDPEGRSVMDASGIVYRNIDLDFEQSSQLTADEALSVCQRHNDDEGTPFNGIIQKNEEEILFDDEQNAFPAYLVQYLMTPPDKDQRRPTCLIDARNSSILVSWDALGTYNDCRAAGVGGNPKIGKIRYGESHKCLDLRRENDTCYLQNRHVRVMNNNFTKIHNEDERRRKTPIASYNCVEIDDYVNGGYSALLDALFYGTLVSRMFEDWYGMSPVGNVITIRVHYGVNTFNAFWNGLECGFGDSDGVNLYPMVALDIVAHEIAHGITEKNSDLYYYEQWGAINEAFSDMTGEVAESYIGEADWRMGFDAVVSNQSIRYFDKPEKDGRSISHADNYTSFLDPHQGSGVYNHAYYTLVHDYGLPIREVYHVFLHANRMYWHHTSNYVQAACDVMKSAYDLGQDGGKFRQAFAEVGIDVCDVEDHVLGLKNKKQYKNIKVSKSISPTFIFGVPGHFVKSLTVNASSSSGDIEIILSDKKWGTTEETVDLYARGLHSVTYRLVENVTLFVTITLTTDSVASLNDVTLVAFYNCVSNFVQDGSHDSSILHWYWSRRCKNRN